MTLKAAFLITMRQAEAERDSGVVYIALALFLVLFFSPEVKDDLRMCNNSVTNTVIGLVKFWQSSNTQNPV